MCFIYDAYELLSHTLKNFIIELLCKHVSEIKKNYFYAQWVVLVVIRTFPVSKNDNPFITLRENIITVFILVKLTLLNVTLVKFLPAKSCITVIFFMFSLKSSSTLNAHIPAHSHRLDRDTRMYTLNWSLNPATHYYVITTAQSMSSHPSILLLAMRV